MFVLSRHIMIVTHIVWTNRLEEHVVNCCYTLRSAWCIDFVNYFWSFPPAMVDATKVHVIKLIIQLFCSRIKNTDVFYLLLLPVREVRPVVSLEPQFRFNHHSFTSLSISSLNAFGVISL